MSETVCSRQESREDDKHEGQLEQPQSTASSFPSCGDNKTSCNSASGSESSPYRDKNTQSVNGGLNSTGIRDDTKKIKIQNEYSKQANFFNMQSAMAAQDAFFKGYDMPTYYGWLPGIAPLRFPAFFYPPSFFGFTPNMGYTENGRMPQGEESDKHDQWNSTKHDTQANSKLRDSSEFIQAHDNDFGTEAQDDVPVDFDGPQDSNSVQKDVVSDVDEGLVLEENDANSLKRRRVLEHDKCQPERRVANVSVIQENSSFQKSAEKTDSGATSECDEQEEENKGPAKRGRASTRQIEKTEQYWDRRKKNNVSAKKSRDARRQREIVTNQRSALLESENLRLRAELATLREENERLRKQLSNLTSSNSS